MLSFDVEKYQQELQLKIVEERQKIEQYYEEHDNFEDLEFEGVTEQSESTAEFTAELKEHDIKGYREGENEYIVEIIHCDENDGGCYLRINGKVIGLVKSKEIDANSRLTMGTNYLEIESIRFNDCGGKRFCDYGYDTTNVVTLSIKRNEE